MAINFFLTATQIHHFTKFFSRKRNAG